MNVGTHWSSIKYPEQAAPLLPALTSLEKHVVALHNLNCILAPSRRQLLYATPPAPAFTTLQVYIIRNNFRLQIWNVDLLTVPNNQLKSTDRVDMGNPLELRRKNVAVPKSQTDRTMLIFSYRSTLLQTMATGVRRDISYGSMTQQLCSVCNVWWHTPLHVHWSHSVSRNLWQS